jgi:hypothetical protein
VRKQADSCQPSAKALEPKISTRRVCSLFRGLDADRSVQVSTIVERAILHDQNAERLGFRVAYSKVTVIKQLKL